MSDAATPGGAATTAASLNGLDLERFWQVSAQDAKPAISSIRRRLPHFPSPPLRVQRVGQLDADLLDQELSEILLAPLKSSLNLIKVSHGT